MPWTHQPRPARWSSWTRTKPATSVQQSFAGYAGRLLEPAIAPLGFDWKMGIGILSSFAAREVFVSTMSIVYSQSKNADENEKAHQQRLQKILAQQKRPGRLGGLHPADGDHADGFLCAGAAMRQHGGGGAAGDQFLEMAGFSMGLYGRAGVGAGLRHLPGRAAAGVQLGVGHGVHRDNK